MNSSQKPDKEPPLGVINGTLEMDRVKLLSLLDEVIVNLHQKITSGRIRDPDNEKLRLAAIKTLAYTASVYGSLLKDHDLKELEARIEMLENAIQKRS
jgi:hypothetical protein